MTTDTELDLKGGRRRVARTRGALSGVLLAILGVWAALIPFIGPYFDFAYTPRQDDAWYWTAGRFWFEVLPGIATVLGALLLLASASRITTLVGGWLAAVGGAWLVVGPRLGGVLDLNAGRAAADPGSGKAALEELLFFYGIGAAILFIASLALGRLSVHSVRDVRTAERRAEAEAAAEAEAEAAERQRIEDERRAEHERRVAAEQRDEDDRRARHATRVDDDRVAEDERRAEHERDMAGDTAPGSTDAADAAGRTDTPGAADGPVAAPPPAQQAAWPPPTPPAPAAPPQGPPPQGPPPQGPPPPERTG